MRLRCVLEPQPAYQWRLALEIEYRLSDAGLRIETTATNLAATPGPFGIGFHPYITVGTATIDDAVLSVPGRQRLLADEQGLPIGESPVAGTADDFTRQRRIGETVLDTAFTDLIGDHRGRAHAVLTDPAAGRHMTLWTDAAYR